MTFKHRGLRAPALSANKEGKYEMSNEFTQEGLRPKTKDWFRLATLMPEDIFSEEQIAQAVEFIQN